MAEIRSLPHSKKKVEALSELALTLANRKSKLLSFR